MTRLRDGIKALDIVALITHSHPSSSATARNRQLLLRHEDSAAARCHLWTLSQPGCGTRLPWWWTKILLPPQRADRWVQTPESLWIVSSRMTLCLFYSDWTQLFTRIHGANRWTGLPERRILNLSAENWFWDVEKWEPYWEKVLQRGQVSDVEKMKTQLTHCRKWHQSVCLASLSQHHKNSLTATHCHSDSHKHFIMNAVSLQDAAALLILVANWLILCPLGGATDH